MIVELENSLDNSLDNQVTIESEHKMLSDKKKSKKHHHTKKHHKKNNNEMIQSQVDEGNKYDIPHNSGNLPNVQDNR